MAHAAAALHQLNLLLVGFDDGTVRVGSFQLVANNKTIRQRSNLKVVADTGHGAALRNKVTEVVEQAEELFFAQGRSVFLFNTGNFAGQTAVHIGRSLLVDVAVGIFEGILGYPYLGGQFVAIEIG